MPEYALTIKNNFKDQMMYKEDFEKLIKEIFTSKGCKVGVLHYELDSNHRLHVHTTVTSSDRLRYKDFMAKGWHIYLREIKERLATWLHYTTKEPRSYDELLKVRLQAMAKETNLFLEWDRI